MKITVTERTEVNGKVLERSVAIEPGTDDTADVKWLARQIQAELDHASYKTTHGQPRT